MAYTTNPYCVLSDVKSALGLRTVTDDAWISSLIVQAQALIDNEVGYSFQSDGTSGSPTTRTFSAHDTESLYVGPISLITQVLEKYTSVSVNFDGFFSVQNYTAGDITPDCFIGPENEATGYLIERLSGLPFNRGKQNYAVSGVWGYQSIPADIQRACIRLTTHFYKMRDTNYSDVLIEQGSVKQKYSKNIPDDVEEILQNYQRKYFFSR